MDNTVQNSAMFWLRCNKCYRLIKKSTKTFSLTQCQHLFCSECIVGEKKCPECESRGVKIVALAKPLQQPLAHYFENVGNHVQRAFEAAHFQGIQRGIAFRRFADIEGKYEEMRRTYHKSAEQMKSLVGAYVKLKEMHASIAADIDKLRTDPPLIYKGRGKDTTNPNFMRDSADRRSQQGQHMMMNSRSNHNESRDNNGLSSPNSSCSSIATPEPRNWHPVSSLNPSRSSIAPPFSQQYNRQPTSTLNSSSTLMTTPPREHQNKHSAQQHLLQSGYHNRTKTECPEHRYRSNDQSMHLGYAPRVIASHVVTPMKDSRHLDAGWAATNRRLGSAGVSTDYSSTGGSLRHTLMVTDNYSNYS